MPATAAQRLAAPAHWPARVCAPAAFCIALAATPWPGAAAEVEGVNLPASVRLSQYGPELVLNGAGLRSKAFLRIYVAGLYLTEKRSVPKDVLAAAGPKRISMTLLRDLAARQLVEALIEGLHDNHTPAEIEAFGTRIEELAGLIGAIGNARAGSVITLDYVPGAGTQVTLNGTARAKPITGEDFYRALLRIWLGDDPADRALKRALLGQPG